MPADSTTVTDTITHDGLSHLTGGPIMPETPFTGNARHGHRVHLSVADGRHPVTPHDHVEVRLRMDLTGQPESRRPSAAQ